MRQTIPDIERALAAVGEQLAHTGATASIVIVGGAALNLLGVVSRETRDVDVIASGAPGDPVLVPPDPLPAPLVRAAATVARDLRLSDDWLNSVVAAQWVTGLPPEMGTRVRWRDFGNLRAGVAGRRDLIFLKLYAAADDVGPTSVHYQDLLALRPTDDELEGAAAWVRTQDTSPDYALIVSEVIRHVRQAR